MKRNYKRNTKLNRSNLLHISLRDKWHSKGNSDKNRAYGNYHAECVEHQNKKNRVLTKTERKKLFSWWWNYEVKNKTNKYPL